MRKTYGKKPTAVNRKLAVAGELPRELARMVWGRVLIYRTLISTDLN